VDLHFEFVQQLAGSLGSGEIDLPAFPDVVGRLQATLVDEDASVREVLGIIRANSAAMNPAGREINNINGAVTRLGFNLVRGTAAAYAIKMIRA
jgi:HD-like signal output (HDOD) protein